MGVKICLGQGGLRSLSASSLEVYYTPFSLFKQQKSKFILGAKTCSHALVMSVTVYVILLTSMEHYFIFSRPEYTYCLELSHNSSGLNEEFPAPPIGSLDVTADYRQKYAL